MVSSIHVEGGSVRQACEEDLPKLVQLDQTIQPNPWGAGRFREELELEGRQLLVFTDDETDAEIWGYVAWSKGAENPEILSLGVGREHRGLGVGEALIRYVANQALREGRTRVWLEVNKSNQPAVQLYQKVGFRIEGIRKNYYPDGQDAYQMDLDLTGERKLIT